MQRDYRGRWPRASLGTARVCTGFHNRLLVQAWVTNGLGRYGSNSSSVVGFEVVSH